MKIGEKRIFLRRDKHNTAAKRESINGPKKSIYGMLRREAHRRTF